MARRGKLSSLDVLPDDIQNYAKAQLEARKLTQIEIRDNVNAMLADRGIEATISRSAFNRFSQREQESFDRIRESMELADAWNEVFTGDSDLTKATRNILSSLAVKIAAGANPTDESTLTMMKDLSLVIKRVEATEDSVIKREREAKKEMAALAAQEVEESASAQGLSADAIKTIKHKILGLAD